MEGLPSPPRRELHVGDPSVRVLVTEPVERAPVLPGLLWIHSGGLVLGSPQFELSLIGPIARDLPAVVVSPDYRLAPEHPVPVRAERLYDTLRETPGRGHFLWTHSVSRFGWTSYLGNPPRHSDAPEYAAAARRPDLSGLVPAWIGVGELDLLYDECVDYAHRLTACGVPCELVTVPGMYHGAELFGGDTTVMQDFRASMIEHVRAHLWLTHRA